MLRKPSTPTNFAGGFFLKIIGDTIVEMFRFIVYDYILYVSEAAPLFYGFIHSSLCFRNLGGVTRTTS